jgi:hypothetical protein
MVRQAAGDLSPDVWETSDQAVSDEIARLERAMTAESPGLSCAQFNAGVASRACSSEF